MGNSKFVDSYDAMKEHAIQNFDAAVRYHPTQSQCYISVFRLSCVLILQGSGVKKHQVRIVFVDTVIVQFTMRLFTYQTLRFKGFLFKKKTQIQILLTLKGEVP